VCRALYTVSLISYTLFATLNRLRGFDASATYCYLHPLILA